MGYKYIDEEVFEYALCIIMRDMIEVYESFQRRLDEFILSTKLDENDTYVIRCTL